MFNSKHYLYVGFMCHQTIEKALKAVVTVVTNDVPPKTHNLVKLYEKANLQDKLSEKHTDLMDELNPLNIEARYTGYKERLFQVLTQDTCKILLKDTEDLLCWIKQQLSTSPDDTQTK